MNKGALYSFNYILLTKVGCIDNIVMEEKMILYPDIYIENLLKIDEEIIKK